MYLTCFHMLYSHTKSMQTYIHAFPTCLLGHIGLTQSTSSHSSNKAFDEPLTPTKDGESV